MNVKAIREKLGMTQMDFAHELGVTIATISRWENSKVEPHRIFKQKMAQMEKNYDRVH